MASDFSFTVKNDLSELDGLNQRVHESIDSFPLSERTRFCVDLVLDELLTNIIKYGSPDHSEHEIQVSVSIDPNEIAIKIEDDCLPFDPLNQRRPDTNLLVEDRPIGGLGIHLLKEMMDHCEYNYVGGSNHLILRKSLP